MSVLPLRRARKPVDVRVAVHVGDVGEGAEFFKSLCTKNIGGADCRGETSWNKTW